MRGTTTCRRTGHTVRNPTPACLRHSKSLESTSYERPLPRPWRRASTRRGSRPSGEAGPAGSSRSSSLAYYRLVATEDLLARPAARARHDRPSRTSSPPATGRPAWPTCGCTTRAPTSTAGPTRGTIIQIVTDDMPFLVDSVTAASAGIDIHLIVHPQLVVRAHVAGGARARRGTRAVDRKTVKGAVGARAESWMLLSIDRESDEGAAPSSRVRLRHVLEDVRQAVEDWPKMRSKSSCSPPSWGGPAGVDPRRGRARDPLPALDGRGPLHLPRLPRLHPAPRDGHEVSRRSRAPASGCCAPTRRSPQSVVLTAGREPAAREPKILVLTKANSRSTVHRIAHLDYVGVKQYDEGGESSASDASSASTPPPPTPTRARCRWSPRRCRRCSPPGRRAGQPHRQGPHRGPRELPPRRALPGQPRAALRHRDGVPSCRSGAAPSCSLREDDFGRFVSCLVYIPRDRYNTNVRLRMADILKEPSAASPSTSRPGSASPPCRGCSSSCGCPAACAPPTSTRRRSSTASSRRAAPGPRPRRRPRGPPAGGGRARLMDRFGRRFPRPTRRPSRQPASPTSPASTSSATAPARARALHADAGADEPDDGASSCSAAAPRSPTSCRSSATWVSRSSTSSPSRCAAPTATAARLRLRAARDAAIWEPAHAELRDLFEGAVAAVWDGRAESDGFNRLVLAARLTWRQVVVLRAVAKYLRQTRATYSQDYLEDALVSHPAIARDLVELWQTRFDPEPSAVDDAARARRREEASPQVSTPSTTCEPRPRPDHPGLPRRHPGRAAHELLPAGRRRRPKSYVSLKLNPKAVPDLPAPRPQFEIWVYSPRVEGVHLRFGPVARGGLRWCDRREDFRTEVLGLVKAQTVKNAVIVPTGAKGGFYAKQLPDPAVDREAWLAEGVAATGCSSPGLLDVTDNRVVGRRSCRRPTSCATTTTTPTSSSPPTRARRPSPTSPTASRPTTASGSATPSPPAARPATTTRPWASPPAARGSRSSATSASWASTPRPQDFTVVGVGDMSGDVFGNGMLLSEHIRLVAAFDHRHVFLDPDPGRRGVLRRARAGSSTCPGSSWDDYDKSLISDGGGVFAAAAKSIPVTPQMAAALGLPDGTTTLTPGRAHPRDPARPGRPALERRHRHLRQGLHRDQLEVGDRANDAIRVDGKRAAGQGGRRGRQPRR